MTAEELLESKRFSFSDKFPEEKKEEFKKWAKSFLNSNNGKEMLLFVQNNKSASISGSWDRSGFTIRAEGSINMLFWSVSHSQSVEK